MNQTQKKIKIPQLLWILLILASSCVPCFASGNPYLDIGVLLFEQGYYKESIAELKIALEHDPESPQALKYIEMAKQSLGILEKKLAQQPPSAKTIVADEQRPLSKEQAINKSLAEFETQNRPKKESIVKQQDQKEIPQGVLAKKEIEQAPPPSPSADSGPKPAGAGYASSRDLPQKTSYPDLFPPPAKESVTQKKPQTVSIHGTTHLAFGIDSVKSGQDFLWRDANFNLSERNDYRQTSWNALNRRENTFDPAIYSRVELAVDVEPLNNPLSFHTDIGIDPWSYVGRSKKETIVGTNGDPLDVQLLYTANTPYTMGQNIDSRSQGDVLSIPELKVVNGKVAPTSLFSKHTVAFVIPMTKVATWFQPVREIWMDYEPSPNIKMSVFPLALEDKAVTTDDPLHLAGNRTWWEDSHWTQSWKPGTNNLGAIPNPDFTKGSWDDSLSFATRDSEGRRLTTLRGSSIEFNKDDTEIDFTVASPKTLWQDYDVVNSAGSSFRAKQHFSNEFYMGFTNNFRAGYRKEDLDIYNNVLAYDLGYTPSPHSKISAEYASSYLKQDITCIPYDTNHRGSAYDLDIMFTSAYLRDAVEEYGYVQPQEGQKNFFKTHLRMTRMEDGFRSNLSSYLETRDDEYWGRHITFRDPVRLSMMNYNDIEPFRIGNGIDNNRYVINWRTDFSLLDKKVKGLTDIRNVHRTSTNEYIETVARTEWGWQPTNRLEIKTLLLAHHLPLTKYHVDPFITGTQGETVQNNGIEKELNPNLNTGSAGLKYWLYDWLAWDGTWELTNDVTVAMDNYPRSFFNEIYPTSLPVNTHTEYGNLYREDHPYLNDYQFFPLPPYEYHNIIRTGFTFKPDSKWDIYLDYTRNPYEFAGPMDDNMNHVGLSATYTPAKNLQLYAKYTWSRLYDVNQVVDISNWGGDFKFASHHNIFLQAKYLLKDESNFTVTFGVGPDVYSSTATGTPYSGYPTIDTQHMVRMSYTKTF